MNSGVGPGTGTDVLFVAEQLRRSVPGGIGTYVEGVVAGLVELGPARGCSVALLASRVRGNDPIVALGLPLVRRPLPSKVLTRLWDLGFDPGRRLPGELVHASSFAIPPRTKRLVVTVHDLAFQSHADSYPARGRAWHEAALRRALDTAQAFVVPSEPVARALVAAGALPEQVAVIEEGADHLPPPDERGLVALRRALGVDGDFLLAVGTLEPRKNLTRLFDAYREAKGELAEPLPLLVVGPNGWGDEAPEVPDGVIATGRVEQATLAALYRAAHLVCYVSLEEGFGLPVVEAMRAGAPVLSSPVPAAMDATILVDPLDTASIARGLVRGSSDETVRRAAIAAGTARADVLTWRRCAEQHVALWRRLLEEPSR